MSKSPLKSVPRRGGGRPRPNPGSIWSNTSQSSVEDDDGCLKQIFGIFVGLVVLLTVVVSTAHAQDPLTVYHHASPLGPYGTHAPSESRWCLNEVITHEYSFTVNEGEHPSEFCARVTGPCNGTGDPAFVLSWMNGFGEPTWRPSDRRPCDDQPAFLCWPRHAAWQVSPDTYRVNYTIVPTDPETNFITHEWAYAYWLPTHSSIVYSGAQSEYWFAGCPWNWAHRNYLPIIYQN